MQNHQEDHLRSVRTCYTNKIVWLLTEFPNSFNAGLAAIKQALLLTYNQECDETTEYTDSKSAIQAITHNKKSSSYIPEIIQQINNSRSAGSQKIFFEYQDTQGSKETKSLIS